MAVSKTYLYDTFETENNCDDKYQINVFGKHLERSANILMSMDNDNNTKSAIQHSLMLFKKYANLINIDFINKYKNSPNKLDNNLIALCIYFRPSLCDNITNFIRQRLLIFTDDFSSFITIKIILHNFSETNFQNKIFQDALILDMLSYLISLTSEPIVQFLICNIWLEFSKIKDYKLLLDYKINKYLYTPFLSENKEVSLSAFTLFSIICLKTNYENLHLSKQMVVKLLNYFHHSHSADILCFQMFQILTEDAKFINLLNTIDNGIKTIINNILLRPKFGFEIINNILDIKPNICDNYDIHTIVAISDNSKYEDQIINICEKIQCNNISLLHSAVIRLKVYNDEIIVAERSLMYGIILTPLLIKNKFQLLEIVLENEDTVQIGLHLLATACYLREVDPRINLSVWTTLLSFSNDLSTNYDSINSLVCEILSHLISIEKNHKWILENGAVNYISNIMLYLSEIKKVNVLLLHYVLEFLEKCGEYPSTYISDNRDIFKCIFSLLKKKNLPNTNTKESSKGRLLNLIQLYSTKILDN
tara:strand:- start:7939 stop:9543 length:1605 start_codon:yes stop_codon:yes gene_type:complete